ncbi:MAG TPA: DUF4091 domain-containing protein [Phycisphaerae bacterium]|nr:DUF4091 domain-containing protein [Phycisphaerae bacterium]
MNRYPLTRTLVVVLAAQLNLIGDPIVTTSPADPELANGPLVITTDFLSGFGWNQRELELREPAISFWLASSLKRVYPTSLPGSRQALDQITPRNARFSFQACLRNDRSWPAEVECSVSGADDLTVQVRRVGYVPQWNYTGDTPETELDGIGHVPGLVPDPLFPESKATVGPFATQSFWITVRVPAEARVGSRKLIVHFRSPILKKDATLTVRVQVHPLVVRPRAGFPVTHWWNADAIYDWYKQPVLGEEWFRAVRPYLENMIEHGSDVILVPMFYMRREIVERPPQLLVVNERGPGQYSFDWSRVKRFVDLAREVGFRQFEWPHFWSYKVDPAKASVDTPTRVYQWKEGRAELLWPKDTEATGAVYRNFLAQFLPEFRDFLARENLLDTSFFHLSDEPGGNPQDLENYRKARELLRELAPWMKVMDAMSDIRYGREKGLTDIPVPAVHAAQAYIDEGIPHWVYYCMGPRGPYLNRFFDTPLAKIRMSGWLFYKLRAQGFLHWGYNYWYVMDLSFNPKTQVLVDPFTDGASGTSAGGAGAPYGDAFVVYPGANGPIDSIRWEVFAESLQDYAILQTAGIKPDDPRLAGIRTYAQFPKSEEWIVKTLADILR